jgi:hypothetical protein
VMDNFLQSQHALIGPLAFKLFEVRLHQFLHFRLAGSLARQASKLSGASR